MPFLPARADLEQLRRQAKDLLRKAERGDPAAATRIRSVSEQLALSSAQLAVAREHGFPSWTRLKLEVERRAVLDGGDAARLGIRPGMALAHPGLPQDRALAPCGG